MCVGTSGCDDAGIVIIVIWDGGGTVTIICGTINTVNVIVIFGSACTLDGRGRWSITNEWVPESIRHFAVFHFFFLILLFLVTSKF